MTNSDVVIPEAAVEAAARGMHAAAHPPESWYLRPDHQQIYRGRARTALEAAAPLMLAAAWSEGAVFESTRKRFTPRVNPYRPGAPKHDDEANEATFADRMAARSIEAKLAKHAPRHSMHEEGGYFYACEACSGLPDGDRQ